MESWDVLLLVGVVPLLTGMVLHILSCRRRLPGWLGLSETRPLFPQLLLYWTLQAAMIGFVQPELQVSLMCVLIGVAFTGPIIVNGRCCSHVSK